MRAIALLYYVQCILYLYTMPSIWTIKNLSSVFVFYSFILRRDEFRTLFKDTINSPREKKNGFQNKSIMLFVCSFKRAYQSLSGRREKKEIFSIRTEAMANTMRLLCFAQHKFISLLRHIANNYIVGYNSTIIISVAQKCSNK